jgi:hypothetical protein
MGWQTATAAKFANRPMVAGLALPGYLFRVAAWVNAHLAPTVKA